MSSIRTEKHSNRKVLYISDKGEIVNVSKRYGIYLGDGRHPDRTYYTLKSTLIALKHLRDSGALDYEATPGSVSFDCLDEKNQPLPGWHRVIDPQHPHWSIVGSKYQEKWLDRGWEQLKRKIEAQPLQSFKSELQGGLVGKTRRQHRNPPLFHFDKGDSRAQDAINHIADQRELFYQSKAQEMPCTYETEDMKELREYVKQGHTHEEWIAMRLERSANQESEMLAEWIRQGYSLNDWYAMKDDQEEVNRRIQASWDSKTGFNSHKLQEAIDYAQSAQKHLDNEKQRQKWLEERNYWKLAQASLKSSSPVDSPSVLAWGKRVGTRIKQAYHSFFAFLVRALNPHASGSK
jgi:hypothetical protein